MSEIKRHYRKNSQNTNRANRDSAGKGLSSSRNSKASAARLVAYKTLEHIRRHNAYAHDSIEKIIDSSDMEPKDKAFATRLVLGVVSTEGVLDAVLDGCLNKPKDIKADVRDALRISVYEMLYLDKPAHVAIHQGVELVASFAPKAKGLANAVLRKVACAAADFPFGDPEINADAFAVECGLPSWLVKYGTYCLGDESARRLFKECIEPPSVFVYINPIKCSDEEFLSALKSCRVKASQVYVFDKVLPGCYLLSDRRAIADRAILALIKAGKLLVSDASAQVVASLSAKVYLKACKDCGVSPSQGSFLELCAGRATKTIMVQGDIFRAESVQSCKYIAIDNLEFKISVLERRCKEYGVEVAHATVCDARNIEEVFGERSFQTVFIDAPCSGLGTMRRHPEIRWKVTPPIIKESAKTGLSILCESSRYVASGGYIVYATCTFAREENEDVITTFLKSPEGSEFKILAIAGKERPFFTALDAPTGADAHFCAILRRS